VLGFDMSEDAIVRAKALAEQSGLRNVQFSVADINELDLPAESVDVAHFSGVLMYLQQPDRVLQSAFRWLKSGGLLAAREAQKAGDWFAGPYAESIALYFKIAVAGHTMRGGDPFLGARLAALARHAGFVSVEATPSYSAGLSNVKATGTAMLSTLGLPDFRATASQCGVSSERFERLADEIKEAARITYAELARAIEDCSDEQLMRPRPGRPQDATWEVVPPNCHLHLGEHLGFWHEAQGDRSAADQAQIWMLEVHEAAFSEPRSQAFGTYNLGCYYARQGRAAEALPRIKRSFELHPDLKEWGRTDKDLDPIRDEPELRAILG